MISAAFLLVLACGSTLTLAGVPTLPGPCPDFKPFENIDLDKASGDWFEHFHGKFGDQNNKIPTEKCEKKTLATRPDGYDVTMTYIDGDGNMQTNTSTAIKVEGAPAKFKVTSDDMPKGLEVVVNILDVDYTNRLVSLLCYSDGSKHAYKVGIYGRAKTLAAAEADKAKEALTSRDLKVELEPVEQNC